ncbi:MAG TPA: sulfotransferase [Mycobacteriales bacterium]|nr:sulfotransferase [Mycobacteriales bacterium]
MNRRLPDHLVIGAAKAGTTSLSRWLDEHPDVYVPPSKEMHFFDRDSQWQLGVEWYAANFADAGDAASVGEATPAYLFVPEAPKRIASVVPDARLIAVLRNPVDRAYSHFWHAHEWGGEPRTFEAAIDALLAGDQTVRPYLRRGYYLEQLQRYEELFPRESMLVLRFDDLAADPAATFRRVCGFLGVRDVAPPNIGKVYNAHSRHRSSRLRARMEGMRAWRRAPVLARALDRLNTDERDYPPMPQPLRQRLLDHFAERNEALAQHLGWDLTGWSR